MSDDYGDRCLAALQPVLAEMGEEHPAYRGMPVAFVGAVEMVGDDGEPYILVLRSSDSTPVWRLLGMTEYVSADLRNHIGRTE